ncbi:MAG: hypothetical protein FWC65_03260 [Treponema sp.]|nr:hypothetical protein [Treponema sp.]
MNGKKMGWIFALAFFAVCAYAQQFDSEADETFEGAIFFSPDGAEMFFGDWQQDAAQDADADALVLTPDEPAADDAQPAPPVRRVRRGMHERANWLSAEGTILGVGIRYERNLNDLFSMGINVFTNLNFDSNSSSELFYSGALGTARFFPGGAIFYLELGAGLGVVSDQQGFMLAPAIGVRNRDQESGFFTNLFVSFPMIFDDDVQTFGLRGGVGLGFAW